MAKGDKQTITENVNPSSDPNICTRTVSRKDARGYAVEVACGGRIFVQSHSHNADNSVCTVTSKCGGCEAVETDTFNQPKITHSESCELAQKQGNKPTIFLASCINQIVWKCGGVITPGHDHDVDCTGISVQDGGFPF